MRRTVTLPAPPVVPLCVRSLHVFVSPCLGDGPSRHYLCNPCAGAWTHTPPSSSSALVHFFLEDTGLAPREPCSADGSIPAMQLPQGAYFRGGSHSLRFRLLRSLGPHAAPTAALVEPGRRAVYTTHLPAGHPVRAVASLRVRSAQLTRLDSHQLGCSLVGCSFPHPALASGNDAKSPQWVGGADAGRGQPAVDEPSHPVPEDSSVLAAPRQDAVPAPADLEPSVDFQRTSLEFATRPAALSTAAEHGISRFPREVFPCVHGVSDRAGPLRISRYRHTGWGLPLSPTASASRRKDLSRLHTRPARTPVNASTPPFRATPHDSGPSWVASPSTYDSFIHNTSPV